VKIAVDFDGTVVREDRAYEDLETPLEFVPYAKEGLHALKRAGHVLMLVSARANRALREDWQLHPLWRQDMNPPVWWEKSQPINEARYRQMLDFVKKELPGVFDCIDDGYCGKLGADVYLDDKALRLSAAEGTSWYEVAERFGDPPSDEMHVRLI
jgi:hypothetical protein